MLVLSRKQNERIRVGESVVLTVVRVGGDKVRLGIEAPPSMRVLRDELEDDDVDDEEDFWDTIDLKKMSRLDLKVALQARNLSTKGSKKRLRERLHQSIEEQSHGRVAPGRLPCDRLLF